MVTCAGGGGGATGGEAMEAGGMEGWAWEAVRHRRAAVDVDYLEGRERRREERRDGGERRKKKVNSS